MSQFSTNSATSNEGVALSTGDQGDFASKVSDVFRWVELVGVELGRHFGDGREETIKSVLKYLMSLCVV
jgi:hypothetical protein